MDSRWTEIWRLKKELNRVRQAEAEARYVKWLDSLDAKIKRLQKQAGDTPKAGTE